MAFQNPITIREAVEHIKSGKYLLPAIQREFVWKPEQIIKLFDSLLKNYPIGSFLLWDVRPEKLMDYQFYNFIRDYHERDRKHNERAELIGHEEVTAVLDGQQRLTSLYVGLLGSYAEKMRYYRWTSDHGFPVRRLYLNISQAADSIEVDYDFDFLEEQADLVRKNGDSWIRVKKALDFQDVGDVIDFLRDHDLLEDRYPQKCLTSLHEAVNKNGVVSAYVERDQDLNKVLNIFIRVNSAGTVLSYSDLLLSIATAQWKDLDAREEIYGFVEEINDTGRGFSFSKDFVLKTCLMLAEIDTRWTVENFTSDNMQKIEGMWRDIKDSIRLTVRLLDSFGFSGDNLPSVNAVIPIAYYMYRKNNPTSYVDSRQFAGDRKLVHRWLNVGLLKRTFTGQPDSILRVCRDTIRESSGERFPDEEIVEAMKTTPQSMRFDAEELAALLEGEYGKSYTFVLLSMLYPWLDFRNKLHTDHIHPRSAFSKPKLRKAGIHEDDEIEHVKSLRDRIPNLQLLQGLPNTEKSDKPFAHWIKAVYPQDAERQQYMRNQYIPSDVGLDLGDFRSFFARRRQLMLNALKEAVGWTEKEKAEDTG